MNCLEATLEVNDRFVLEKENFFWYLWLQRN